MRSPSRGQRVVHKDEYTLEELAAKTGMTARNVRAYQTKGLIPNPSRSGRRSVYGTEHLLRLQAIEQARRRGASLSLIAAHLAAGRPLDDNTLVGWSLTGPVADPRPLAPRPPAPAAARTDRDQDISPLLASSDLHSSPAAQTDVAELMAAGVFTTHGDGIYTGKELADSMIALHRSGFPLQLTLRIARRALSVAIPLTAALWEVTEGVETAAVRTHLGEAATFVVHQLLTRQQEPPTAQ